MLSARKNHNYWTRHNVEFFDPERVRNDVYKNMYPSPTEEKPEKVQIEGVQTVIRGNQKQRRSKYQK